MKHLLLVTVTLLLVAPFESAIQAQDSPDVTTYINAYANFIPSGQAEIAPEDVQTTSDGGYVLLNSSGGPAGPASWLLKIDSSGVTQWSQEVGNFNAPPGSYSIASSLLQTSDGGYILAGGTQTVSVERALVEKVNSSGGVEWAYTYTEEGSYLSQIKQTRDGGYIAVGGTSRSEGIYAALILRLNSAGHVLWQKVLGPSGSTLAALVQLVTTSDGGFATLGFTYIPQGGSGIESVVVGKYTAVGVLQWQIAYNEPNGHQAPFSLAQTSDGGYLVGGATSTISGEEAGALLLKLGPRGNIQWQKAYSSALGGEVVNSVHQASDGGYVLVGDSSSPACGGIVPWMAKVDSSGAILWEHLYFETIQGCPKSEYFQPSVLTGDGGILATGWTEDPQSRIGELFVVKTDSAGLCSSGCGEIYSVPQPTAINISLTPMLPLLPVNVHVTPGSTSPAEDQATTVVARQDCD